jgi:putative spermidine/putrescine transport system ATP-binding protein
VRLCGSEKQADGYDNRFRARVREIIYLGDHVRVRLAIDDTTELMAKVPIDSADAALSPDAQVVVAWSAGDCHAFAPE